MKKTIWDYKVVQINPVNQHLQTALQREGEDGWELVAIHRNAPHTELVFKRPAE